MEKNNSVPKLRPCPKKSGGPYRHAKVFWVFFLRSQIGEIQWKNTGLVITQAIMGVLFFWTRYSLSENGREIRKKSIFTKLKKSAITDIFGGWVIKYQVGPNIRPTCSQNFRPLAPKLTKIERFKVGVLFHMKCKYLKIREI